MLLWVFQINEIAIRATSDQIHVTIAVDVRHGTRKALLESIRSTRPDLAGQFKISSILAREQPHPAIAVRGKDVEQTVARNICHGKSAAFFHRRAQHITGKRGQCKWRVAGNLPIKRYKPSRPIKHDQVELVGTLEK